VHSLSLSLSLTHTHTHTPSRLPPWRKNIAQSMVPQVCRRSRRSGPPMSSTSNQSTLRWGLRLCFPTRIATRRRAVATPRPPTEPLRAKLTDFTADARKRRPIASRVLACIATATFVAVIILGGESSGLFAAGGLLAKLLTQISLLYSGLHVDKSWYQQSTHSRVHSEHDV